MIYRNVKQIMIKFLCMNNLLKMETLFLALADKTRLRLLNLMRDGEVCVCFLVEALNEPQAKISRHLAYMRQAEIVSARREGKWMHYRIVQPADEYADQVLNDVLSWLKSQEQMQFDRERLIDICRRPQFLPVQLQRAPRPANISDEPLQTENVPKISPLHNELETFLL